jgi:uncharacterized membrane protein YfcA
MPPLSFFDLLLLVLVFFVTSAIGVVTGSNSLITVPVMFQFGIDPKVAVATNMFGLTFLSIGAAIPFTGKGVFDRKRIPLLVLLTVIGSALGAILVVMISAQAMPLIISISMIAITLFSIFQRKSGIEKKGAPSKSLELAAYVLTFALGIYGGLFSGGYVTLLTVVFVAFLGHTYTEAIANTKLINVFSSLIATVIFAWQGLIDYSLGLILAVTMFIAAFFGAKFVTKMSDIWLRRIFLATVFLLAAKILFLDVLRLGN